MTADLSSVVADLKSDLLRRADEVGAATLERSLSDIVRAVGWQNRSVGRMRLLVGELRARGIRCLTDLTDMAVAADGVVRFERVPEKAPTPPLEPGEEGPRVFLSYGRRDAEKLADRLIPEIRSRNLTPWKDEYEIRSGSEWESVIKAGIRTSEAMVAILSQASVRTAHTSTVLGDTDSVCLDEIAFARYKSPPTPIVPVLAMKCEPPLSVFRLDYVDMVGWDAPGFEWKKVLDRLFAGLEAVRSGQDFFRSSATVLKPIDFESYIASKRRNFFGRKWLFDSILEEFDSSGSLLVVGDPGIGKSAAMAELVHRNFDGRVDAYHFCRANRPATLRPGAFVRSIAAMLASRHRPYGKRLEAGEFWDVLREAESDADPHTALETGVLDPLNKIEPPKDGYRILIVDSLDEALRVQDEERTLGGLSIVEVLESQVDGFPSWLRLLATSRNEPEAVDSLDVLQARRLEAGSANNLDDVREYIRHRSASGILGDKFARAKKTGMDLIDSISEAAKGNFLYAAKALDAFESGHLDVKGLLNLPAGLGQQYNRFFSRRYRSKARFKPVRSVLECIVAGPAPVPEPDLALATGLDAEYDLPERLEELSEFLHVTETESGTRRYSLFHKSFGDWLSDPKRRGKAFRAGAFGGHRRMADALFKVYRSDPVQLSEYGLVHLPDHLSALVHGRTTVTADPKAAEHLSQFVLDDRVQALRADDPQGVMRSIRGALAATVGTQRIETTPQAVETATGLRVFESERLEPRRLFKFARKDDLARLRGELDLFPLDAAWRGATLVTLAWAEIGEDEKRVKLLRDEAARHISEHERELRRLDEFLANGSLKDWVGDEPEEPRIRALLAQVGGARIGEDVKEHMGEITEQYRGSLAEPVEEYVTEGGTERRASHADLFAHEFVAYAARHPGKGEEYLESYIERHAQNTYRQYRRASLRSILLAVLDHPEPAWIAKRLKKIVHAELSASNPEFTECSPAALASLRYPAEFDQFVDQARQAATELPDNPVRGEGDTWGSHKRRLAVAAESLSRGRGDVSTARQLLRQALDLPYGFAGFQAPACMSLAESIKVADSDSGTLIEEALDRARVAAHNIFEQTFAIRMTSRCNAIIENWWPAIPAVEDVIDRFAMDPARPEFSALHIVGWPFAGRGDGAEPIPEELRRSNPTLADLARAFRQPIGEFRRLNPELPKTAGLADGTHVRVPDPEFAPVLAGRLASEALVTMGDSHEKVLAIRKLLPIAADHITALDLVISRMILAIASLPDRDALLKGLRPVVATWFPRLPAPKASAKDLLKAME